MQEFVQILTCRCKLVLLAAEDSRFYNELYRSHGNNYINLSGFSHGFLHILVLVKVKFFDRKCPQDMHSGY